MLPLLVQTKGLELRPTAKAENLCACAVLRSACAKRSWARVTYEVGFEVSHGSGALKGLQELLPFLYIALGFVGVQNGE